MPSLTPGVIILESPYTDPVTVAFDAVDALSTIVADCDDTIERLRGKLARLQEQVDQTNDAIEDAIADRAQRDRDVKQAQVVAHAAAEADPVLAIEVKARRAASIHQRRAELEDQLKRIGKAD